MYKGKGERGKVIIVPINTLIIQKERGGEGEEDIALLQIFELYQTL